MHKRQEIREKLKSFLLGNTIAGQNVFTNRVKPLQEREVPAIVIRSGGDSTTEWSDSPRRYKHSYTIHFDLSVEGKASDDILDEFADQIEKIILPNQTLDGLVADITEPDTDSPDIATHEAKRIYGDLRFSIQVIYYSKHVPSIPDDFESSGIKYDVDNEENENQPCDEINFI